VARIALKAGQQAPDADDGDAPAEEQDLQNERDVHSARVVLRQRPYIRDARDAVRRGLAKTCGGEIRDAVVGRGSDQQLTHSLLAEDNRAVDVALGNCLPGGSSVGHRPHRQLAGSLGLDSLCRGRGAHRRDRQVTRPLVVADGHERGSKGEHHDHTDRGQPPTWRQNRWASGLSGLRPVSVIARSLLGREVD
jgi:hypothetical protein